MADAQTKDSHVRRRTGSAIDKLSEKYVPDAAKPYVEKAKPYLGAFVEFVAMIYPHLSRAYTKIVDFYVKLKPYHIDDLAPAILGLIICFFGGTYMTLIAAVEAYRITGWDSTKRAFGTLYQNGKRAAAASKEDDKIDADGDGQSDVQQLLDAGEVDDVLKRKVGVVLRSVDPNEVTDALAAINTGFLAVLATLKVQFAKAITLGSAIGEIITKPCVRFGEPILSALLPDDLRKWSTPIIKYTCKCAAISMAWTLQRIISTVHSSIRGGLMCARGLLSYLGKIGVLEIQHEETLMDEAVAAFLAFSGFTFQIGYGFSLPFPMNIICLPFTVIEYWLIWMLNWY